MLCFRSQQRESWAEDSRAAICTFANRRDWMLPIVTKPPQSGFSLRGKARAKAKEKGKEKERLTWLLCIRTIMVGGHTTRT